MESIDEFQIRYTNTEAIEGNIIESMQNSNIFKMKMDVYYKMSLSNFQTYKSFLPRMIIKPDSSKNVINY